MVAVAVGLSCSGGMGCPPCHWQLPWNLLNASQPALKALLNHTLLRNGPQNHLVVLVPWPIPQKSKALPPIQFQRHRNSHSSRANRKSCLSRASHKSHPSRTYHQKPSVESASEIVCQGHVGNHLWWMHQESSIKGTSGNHLAKGISQLQLRLIRGHVKHRHAVNYSVQCRHLTKLMTPANEQVNRSDDPCKVCYVRQHRITEVPVPAADPWQLVCVQVPDAAAPCVIRAVEVCSKDGSVAKESR